MKSLMKWMLVLLTLSSLGVWFNPTMREAFGLTINDAGLIQQAYSDRVSNIHVETDATVTLLLPVVEDLQRIQVFAIELENGHKLYVHHDLDLAPSVPVKPGALIRLRGEYDWSPDGGVIHWTHADPAGKRDGGWIEVQGRRYF